MTRRRNRVNRIAGTALSNTEREALELAVTTGESAALLREVSDIPIRKSTFGLTVGQEEVVDKDEETMYYQIQSASEETPKQIGPPVDLSLVVLGMELLRNGRYRCITGAAAMCLKSHGKLPLSPAHGVKDEVKEALEAMAQVLQIRGGILRDQTGLGKTKQVLVMLALHGKYRRPKSMLPMLLIVPASLVKQWAKEIRESWPGFTLWICYSEEEWGAVYR